MAYCFHSSSWFLIVALSCSFTVSLVCNDVYVVPGDEDPSCFNSPFRVPVPPQQNILLDTQNYEEQTLIDSNGGTQRWVSENFDGLETNGVNYNWRDSAQTAMCYHQLLACDPDNQPQDNWLITQFINITDDNVEQLVVNMTFTTAAIPCSNCQQSFSMQAYETNIPDETGRVNQSFYQDTGTRYFHIQNNEDIESALDSFTITSKGLYLAVIDTGSCTRINRLYVFYYVCPSQVVNMIQYPETVSPPTTNPQDKTAMGTCIDNASPIDGAILELDCTIFGNWETSELGCSCDPGYEIIMGICQPCIEGTYKLVHGNEECMECPVNSNSTLPGATSCGCIPGYHRSGTQDVTVGCTACIEGEFKLVHGNEECIECPVNSNSTLPGATSCDCFPGYYRSYIEGATVGCTAPPTAPGNIDANISSTSITITWTPPTDNGGRTDLYYMVAYSNNSFTSTPVNIYNTTQYTITGLMPSTQYTVTVTTNNGVSNQDPYVADRTATINVTTIARESNTEQQTGSSSLYYGLGGSLSAIVIVLVCVAIIAIIYHTLVKGKSSSKQVTSNTVEYNPQVVQNV